LWPWPQVASDGTSPAAAPGPNTSRPSSRRTCRPGWAAPSGGAPTSRSSDPSGENRSCDAPAWRTPEPDATAEVLKDGWFYTGDIGEIDGDGFLKITDRKKSLFKTAGGKYVAPQQLEHALLSDPLVARSVIVGEGKPYVTALIVPDWDAARKQGMDEAAVKARMQKTVDSVNAHLGQWETIKYFTLLPQDFTEANGELSLKQDVKRKVVAEHFKDQIEAMYAGKSKAS